MRTFKVIKAIKKGGKRIIKIICPRTPRQFRVAIARSESWLPRRD